VYESAGYIEAPFSREWSLVATPWIEQNYDTLDGWRGEGSLGLKRSWSDDAGAFAVQAGGFWQSHPDEGCSEGGAELRAMWGRNLGEDSFVNTEAAASLLSGGCAGERIDLTLGRRWGERWLGMTQIFADGRASAGYEDNLKAQVSLVRFDASGNGIQLGFRARLDGEDAEPAFIVGLWRRGRD
jgi:hypothetical protein